MMRYSSPFIWVIFNSNDVLKFMGLEYLFTDLSSSILYLYTRASLVASGGKESTCNEEVSGSVPGSGDTLEKEMATHPSILAWRIPWTEETGGF